MATTDVGLHEAAGLDARVPVVNNMSIQVATVKGSGSQSSNTVLLRSIFQMGVPVSGKNLFPSNIAGLPTWYTIRANKDGYVARKKEIDFLIAMNVETARDDVMSLDPGAAVLYDEPLDLRSLRDDLIFYSVPYDKLVATVCPEAKLRKLVKNMVYVGVVASLLTIDMAEVEKAIRKQFAAKAKAANLNLAAAQAGFEYAKANLQKRGVFYIERMDKTAGKIIIDGNSAAALGCMFAGCTVVTWYPITPSSSLVETMIEYMKEYRITPDGKGEAFYKTRSTHATSLALDTSGNREARLNAIRSTKVWGTMCFVGEGGHVHIDVSPHLLRRQLTLVASWTFSNIIQADCARFSVERGIDVDQLFTHRWSLDQAEEAYQLFDRQVDGKGVFLM